MCAPLCSRPFSSILFRHSAISLLFPHDQPQTYLCSHRPASWCLNRPLSVPSGPIQFPNSRPFTFRFDSDFLFFFFNRKVGFCCHVPVCLYAPHMTYLHETGQLENLIALGQICAILWSPKVHYNAHKSPSRPHVEPDESIAYPRPVLYCLKFPEK